MIKSITDLLLTALYTVLIQNLVLSMGLGLSESIRVSTRPGIFVRIAVMISGFSVVTSTVCSLIDSATAEMNFPYAARAAIYGAVLAAVYTVAAIVLRFIFKADRKFLGTLGIAAFNTLVFAIPFIDHSAGYTLADSIGSGIGAGIAFVFAAALISKGSEMLEKNKDIPEIYKGTPAMFLYAGLLSLAFAGFSDTVFFS